MKFDGQGMEFKLFQYDLCLPGHLVLIGILGETPRVELGEFNVTSDKFS